LGLFSVIRISSLYNSPSIFFFGNLIIELLEIILSDKVVDNLRMCKDEFIELDEYNFVIFKDGFIALFNDVFVLLLFCKFEFIKLGNDILGIFNSDSNSYASRYSDSDLYLDSDSDSDSYSDLYSDSYAYSYAYSYASRYLDLESDSDLNSALDLDLESDSALDLDLESESELVDNTLLKCL
jgi:hypothetical protein